MFAGLFGSAAGVRLDDTAREELAVMHGSGPFGPAQRPMGEYTSLPADWRSAPDPAVHWVDRALSYVRLLPPKVKKPKRART